MYNRPQFYQQIQQAAKVHPVVALLGPRQCGKTTLAKQYCAASTEAVHYFDLEDPEHLARLSNAKLTLSALTGLIVIDEIQRLPELFPLLRVLVDQHLPQQFLILGSASKTLIQQSSESLAGRIQYIELTPFDCTEVEDIQRLWLQGGFPKAYLADDNSISYQWREAYVQTFLEQDIPNLGIQISPLMLRRFWMMICHYHGSICNYSELGRALNLSHKTVRHYMDILTATFMTRQLQPWFENISKRQVKSEKIYLRDSGILHTLLRLPTAETLSLHPLVGASWEGFALESIIRLYNARPQECFFWGTQGHAELDLLIVQGDQKHAFEFKYSDHPKTTKSMHLALQDLQLEQLTIICPGEHTYPLHEQIQVSNIKDMALKVSEKSL
jgi:hypothetical protein